MTDDTHTPRHDPATPDGVHDSTQAFLLISDMASLTRLPAQTLRYYHSEELLVPAEVDQHTGYRGYTFSQVHRALLITALRRAGISISGVRSALEAPDTLPARLAEHRATLEHQRATQDEALAQAGDLAEGWPVLHHREVAASVGAALRLPGSAAEQAAGRSTAVIPEHVHRSAAHLMHALSTAGVPTLGPPWCSHALESDADKRKLLSADGPDWRVIVDLDVDVTGRGDPRDLGGLPAGIEVLPRAAGREAFISFPGAPQVVALAAAFEHLTAATLEQRLVADLGGPRYVLHEDGRVDLAVTVLDAQDATD